MCKLDNSPLDNRRLPTSWSRTLIYSEYLQPLMVFAYLKRYEKVGRLENFWSRCQLFENCRQWILVQSVHLLKYFFQPFPSLKKFEDNFLLFLLTSDFPYCSAQLNHWIIFKFQINYEIPKFKETLTFFANYHDNCSGSFRIRIEDPDLGRLQIRRTVSDSWEPNFMNDHLGSI
jgi:hypothetical protein